MTGSGSGSRSGKDEIPPRRTRSMTRATTALKSSQHEEDGNMNNKGKAPMPEIVELESNSCGENETLSPGDEMDEDVDAQMMEPLETNIQEGMAQASSNKKKCNQKGKHKMPPAYSSQLLKKPSYLRLLKTIDKLQLENSKLKQKLDEYETEAVNFKTPSISVEVSDHVVAGKDKHNEMEIVSIMFQKNMKMQKILRIPRIYQQNTMKKIQSQA
jgi:hypothetical protein